MKDKILIINYINDYLKLVWTAPTLIVLFILSGYPNLNLLPEYIFNDKYRAPLIIIGFLVIVNSLLNIKHGMITGFTKKFATQLALHPYHGLIKRYQIEGTYIKSRGIKASVISLVYLVLGIILMVVGLKA